MKSVKSVKIGFFFSLSLIDNPTFLCLDCFSVCLFFHFLRLLAIQSSTIQVSISQITSVIFFCISLHNPVINYACIYIKLS